MTPGCGVRTSGITPRGHTDMRRGPATWSRRRENERPAAATTTPPSPHRRRGRQHSRRRSTSVTTASEEPDPENLSARPCRAEAVAGLSAPTATDAPASFTVPPCSPRSLPDPPHRRALPRRLSCSSPRRSRRSRVLDPTHSTPWAAPQLRPLFPCRRLHSEVQTPPPPACHGGLSAASGVLVGAAGTPGPDSGGTPL